MKRIRSGGIWMAAVFALLCSAAFAASADKEAEKKAMQAISETALASAVVVEIVPQMDGVEEPITRFMSEKCPNCGNYHSSGMSEYISAERSLFLAGYMIAPDAVISADIGLNPENIKSVKVLRKGKSVAASFDGVYEDQAAMRFKLSGDLAGVQPAVVSAKAGKPERSVVVTQSKWGAVDEVVATAASATGETMLTEDGKAIVLNKNPVMLFDGEGRVCGFNFNSRASEDGKYDPYAWQYVTIAGLNDAMKSAADAAERSALPVTLMFRSPKAQRSGRGWAQFDMTEEDNITDLKTVGYVIDGTKIVVHIGDARKPISRLDKIKVYHKDGTVEDATFSFVNKYANYMVAELPSAKPDSALKISKDDFETSSQNMQMLVNVTPAGDGKTKVRANRVRLLAREFGWRNIPSIDMPVSEEVGSVVFNLKGEALWSMVDIRMASETFGSSSKWSYRSSAKMFVPSEVFAALSSAEEKDVDSSARPVAEVDDNAIGWVGIDLQGLDPDLAEAMGAMAQTENGSFGAIVQRVHPGSSADKAGVKPDWIILSIKADGDAMPRKVEVEDGMSEFRSSFPWNRLGDVPPEYMDRIPTPWPSVKNDFTVALMSIGVGSAVQAEFLADGERVTKKLTVEKGPQYFDNAKSYKWEPAGISVCDLTFEVRETLNLADDAPGVVVCKMETSGKAITAGIKKFEVITRVNDAPVRSADEFKALVEGNGEFKLNVLRMADSRVVQFKIDGADAEPGDNGESADEADGGDEDEAQVDDVVETIEIDEAA